MIRLPLSTTLLTLAVIASGCEAQKPGEAVIKRSQPADSSTSEGDGISTLPAKVEDGIVTGSDGVVGDVSQALQCKPESLSPARAWRLDHAQYKNSIAAVFNYTSINTSSLLPDSLNNGFNNNADANYVSDMLAKRYKDNAKQIATALADKLSSSNHSCMVTNTPSDRCLNAFIQNYVSKGYRRPIPEEEAKRYRDFFNAQRTKYGSKVASRMLFEIVLQSPHFLYRVEAGELASEQDSTLRLTDYEIAAQLAFLITDSPPDSELYEAAAAGKLQDKAEVEKQARRLMTKPQAREKLKHFFTQYLHIDKLLEPSFEKDSTKFPTFTTDLRKAMMEETLTFADKVVWEEDGSFETLLTAPYSYINSSLAKHYGVASDGFDSSFKKVEFSSKERGGILTHASMLAAHSANNNTSPVHRGLFVRDTLLCLSAPTPPPGADAQTELLRSPDPMATEKEHFAHFQKVAPSCASCHGLFHPLGLAFENYDPVGRYRESEFGKLIDPSGTFVGAGGLQGDFSDGIDLARKVAGNERAHVCFVNKYYTFAFGEKRDDSCTIASSYEQFKNSNLSIKEVLIAMTQDEQFYLRKK